MHYVTFTTRHRKIAITCLDLATAELICARATANLAKHSSIKSDVAPSVSAHRPVNAHIRVDGVWWLKGQTAEV